jgi:hypothetical protein
MSVIVLAHAAATWMMVGVIWFVQIIHYPLFTRVGPDQFVDYETANTRLTAYVVGPPMAIEGLTSLLLLFAPPAGIDRLWSLVGLGLLGLALLSTIAVQVPAHNELSQRFDERTVDRLVTTNWVRTVAWSARGMLALLMIQLAA